MGVRNVFIGCKDSRSWVKDLEKASLCAEKTSSCVKETSFCGIMTSFQMLSYAGEVFFHTQVNDFALGGRRLPPLTPRSFNIGLQPLKVWVVRVSFEMKVKGEHRNFALGKISPKGKFPLFTFT